jgi:ABC-2 type transport system ATP-binding protein
MTDAAIEVSGLSHRYPAVKAGREWALRNMDLTVGRGRVFALLGPNGAGKTTLIKILSTLLIPTRGMARVLAHDVVRDVKEVRSAVGLVLGGERGLYDRLTAWDNLVYFAELYGMGRWDGRARVAEVLDLVELADSRDKRVEQFSRGMKQRLHIARGILHRPQVLLLDEPTIGVDPVGARRLRSLVRHLNDQGTTILLTTHYMHEAEQLAHDVAILREGRIVVRGSPQDVRRLARVQGVVEAVADGIPPKVLASIGGWPTVTGVDVYEHQGRQHLLIGTTGGGEVEIRQLDHRLRDVGLHMSGWRPATLEDAYVEFVATDRAGRA